MGVDEPTLFEIDSGNVLALWVHDGQVRLEWYGPRRVDMSADTTRALGYLLRSASKLAEAGAEPSG